MYFFRETGQEEKRKQCDIRTRMKVHQEKHNNLILKVAKYYSMELGKKKHLFLCLHGSTKSDKRSTASWLLVERIKMK